MMDINKIMGAVVTVAQMILDGKHDKAVEVAKRELVMDDIAMSGAVVAMITEEVNAKQHTDITETFGNIRDYIFAGRVEYLPAAYRTVVSIAVELLGGIEETFEMFNNLVTISADVTEECGVYAGGF